ncbi:hypothetical protein ACHAXS_003794 [Conticribra weissflogii]
MAGSKPTRTTLLSILAVCGTIAIYRHSSFHSNRDQHAMDAATLASLPLHPSIEIPSIPPSRNTPRGHHLESSSSHRRLSVALPDGGCQITWPEKPAPGTAVTYAASYPGCGARMTWNLVEALTGLWTGDDWNNNGRGRDVVTVKTHYPQSNGILVDFNDEIKRAFVVVRNPLKSIPSFFNHIYEMRNHLPVHSQRAPVDEWVKWRDHYLDIEIDEYKKFMFYWMDRYTPENRLVITYEGLTDDLIGGEVTKSLARFLGQAEGVNPIAEESVPCVWGVVVKNKQPTLPPGPAPKPDQAAAVFFGNFNPNEAMVNNSPSYPQDQPNPYVSQSAIANSYQSQSANPYGSAQQEQQQPQGMQQHQSPLQSSYGSPSYPEASMQFNSYGGQSSNNYGGQYSSSYGAQSASNSYGAPPQEQQQSQQQEEQQSSSYPAFPVPPQSNSYYQPYNSNPPNQPNFRHMMRRRLDPGHHDSQRKGPDEPRPYTSGQLDKMMNMLMEIAQRYQDDARLNQIMMGYYDKVKKAKEELGPGAGSQQAVPVAPPNGFF